MNLYVCVRYSHYAVSLAYHVIAMWFIKCRQPFKRGFVQYIVKVYHLCCVITLRPVTRATETSAINRFQFSVPKITESSDNETVSFN